MIDSLACCVLSPWMVVAGNSFMHNQCSKESAPFFVSTKTKVRACYIRIRATISDTLITAQSQMQLNGTNKLSHERDIFLFKKSHPILKEGKDFPWNSRTFPWAPLTLWAWRRSIRWLLLSESRTNSTLWTIRSVLEPTLPTARKM